MDLKNTGTAGDEFDQRRLSQFIFRVQMNAMSVPVKNVQVGGSSVSTRLASTGVCTCIAIIICPDDGTTFIHHVDPISFNLGAESLHEECITIIKMTIESFKECKGHSSFGQIFVFGGLNDDDYEPLHNAFNLLLINHSAGAIGAAESINGDVRAFCEALVCVNLLMNISNKNENEATCASTFVTDLTVMSDRTTDPATLWIAQYFGTEGELQGGRRSITPWLFFIYDFVLHGWCAVDLHPRDHPQSALVSVVLADFQRSQVVHPSNLDALKEKVWQIFNTLAMIED
jgi:hypothetical protein